MSRKVPDIELCKRDADLLLKDLRDGDRNQEAAARFQRLAPFKSLSRAEIADAVQRKHALDVIARENGFLNWAKLKQSQDNLWIRPVGGPRLHVWCKSHEEAIAYRDANGGYILTDRGVCFVADRDYIEALGLDPDDDRWAKIDYDCCAPADQRAYAELIAKLPKRKSA